MMDQKTYHEQLINDLSSMILDRLCENEEFKRYCEHVARLKAGIPLGTDFEKIDGTPAHELYWAVYNSLHNEVLIRALERNKPHYGYGR